MTETLHTVFFSPTGTSKRIAEAIDRGYGAVQTEIIDLTHRTASATLFPTDTLTLFVVPVYGGQVAPAALARMEQLRGTQTPATIVVVYGNRDIGQAATQLSDILTRQGFRIVAAAAFVGEHSYSSTRYPIAAGRPDTDDLDEAVAFGEALRRKLTATKSATIDATRLRAPRTPVFPMLRFIGFVLGYRRRQKKQPVVLLPTVDAELCTHCGVCVTRCPVRAIAEGHELDTDPARCIRCCACVKGCHRKARTFETPFAEALSRSFRRAKPPVTLL